MHNGALSAGYGRSRRHGWVTGIRIDQCRRRCILARVNDLGIPLPGLRGPLNAITDVDGVHVGHTTLLSGEGELVVGEGPVRTGVTAVLPRGKTYDPVFAGWYDLNGNGEMTGRTWIEESGFLETPIVITNTFSVGVARDAVISWMDRTGLNADPEEGWCRPADEFFDGRFVRLP